MKMPALGPETSLRVSRQGGFVAAPSLARPRQIEFSDCDAEQRRGLCSVVERCLPVASKNVGAGDQRFFRVELHYRREDTDAELPPAANALCGHCAGRCCVHGGSQAAFIGAATLQVLALEQQRRPRQPVQRARVQHRGHAGMRGNACGGRQQVVDTGQG